MIVAWLTCDVPGHRWCVLKHTPVTQGWLGLVIGSGP